MTPAPVSSARSTRSVRTPGATTPGTVLAARIDLTDHEVLGGIERNRAIGINWYVGQRFRVMMERIDIAAEPNSAGIDEHPSILQMRLQATL